MTDYREYVEGLHAQLLSSGIYLSIFSEAFKENPKCLIELAMAVMLDKPIYLLVKQGTSVPENMKRLARGIEFFKGEEDIPLITEKIARWVDEEPAP